MARGFRFLDHIAMADVAFEAWGETPSELVTAASEGLAEVMADPATVGTEWKQRCTLSYATLSEALFEWLSYLVFLKDTEGVVFHAVNAEARQDPDSLFWNLKGEIVGESINPQKQELRADVKAVTKHLYEVKEQPGDYRARVVLDV